MSFYIPPLLGGPAEPFFRLFKVFLHTVPVSIATSQEILCRFISLLGSLPIPFCGLFQVFLHTVPVFIAKPQVPLGRCISLLGGLPEPI